LKRLQVVDLVRAYAILVVIAFHLGTLYIVKASQPQFLAYLWFRFWMSVSYGLTLFFVVSGFVISRLIASESGGLFNPDYRNFYSRRVGRILPLLVLACLIGITMISFFSKPSGAFEYVFQDIHKPLTRSFWVSVVTFSVNWYQIFSPHSYIGLQWSVLWSLSIEEQFYFFYPLVLKRLQNKRNLTLFLIAVIVLGPVLGKLFQLFFKNIIVPERNSFENFSFIAIGCLLYLVSTRYEEVLSKNKMKSVQLCLLGLVLVGTAYSPHFLLADRLLGEMLMAWGGFFFLLGGLHLNIFNSKHWSIFTSIGRLSYGGYLYHAVVLYFLWPFLMGKNDFFDFFILSAATFFLAGLSFRFFEVPANLWIRKILNH
jgi:peptidoglycan/LPS O-acetylase OafA/YrhL